VTWQAGSPTTLIWYFNPAPIDDIGPGNPRPSLQAFVNGAWEFPGTTGPFDGDHVTALYSAAIGPADPVRVLAQPQPFHWADRILRLPWRGANEAP